MNKNKIAKFKSKLIKDEINQRIFCDRYQLSYNVFRGAINSCKGFRMKPEFEEAIDNYLTDIKPMKMPWKEVKAEIEEQGIKIKKNSNIFLMSHKNENEIYNFLQYLSEKDIPQNKFNVLPFRGNNYQHEWYLAVITSSKYRKLFSDICLDYLKGEKQTNEENKKETL